MVAGCVGKAVTGIGLSLQRRAKGEKRGKKEREIAMHASGGFRVQGFEGNGIEVKTGTEKPTSIIPVSARFRLAQKTDLLKLL